MVTKHVIDNFLSSLPLARDIVFIVESVRNVNIQFYNHKLYRISIELFNNEWRLYTMHTSSPE